MSCTYSLGLLSNAKCIFSGFLRLSCLELGIVDQLLDRVTFLSHSSNVLLDTWNSLYMLLSLVTMLSDDAIKVFERVKRVSGAIEDFVAALHRRLCTTVRVRDSIKQMISYLLLTLGFFNDESSLTYSFVCVIKEIFVG